MRGKEKARTKQEKKKREKERERVSEAPYSGVEDKEQSQTGNRWAAWPGLPITKTWVLCGGGFCWVAWAAEFCSELELSFPASA